MSSSSNSDSFPLGADADRFIRAFELPQVHTHMERLKEGFGGRKLVLAINRLDMIIEIRQRLLAFEKFLEDNPIWRDKVTLLQIALPPSTYVYTNEVYEIVGRINGRFGTPTAVPVNLHHLNRTVDIYELCALYAMTNIALFTSTGDEMELMSYEFIACQAEKKGVLILSEFGGAAQYLRPGALLVNPSIIAEVATSVCYALEMPTEERERRHMNNFTLVTAHTSHEFHLTVRSTTTRRSRVSLPRRPSDRYP